MALKSKTAPTGSRQAGSRKAAPAAKSDDQAGAATETQERDSPLLDLSDQAVKKLLKTAKARGYVTYDELNSVLPSEEVSSEQIEDTMAMLSERVARSLPHMGPESLKVIAEDGRIYSGEVTFPSGSASEPADGGDLVAVGIVSQFVGVKVHHGLGIEAVIELEAQSFSGRLNDQVDFGIFNFLGEQLASVEDMIAFLGVGEPEVPKVAGAGAESAAPAAGSRRHHRARRRSGGGRGGQGAQGGQGGRGGGPGGPRRSRARGPADKSPQAPGEAPSSAAGTPPPPPPPPPSSAPAAS